MKGVSPVAISVVQDLPELRIAVTGPLLVTVWFREATIRALEAMFAAQAKVTEEHGHSTVLAIVVTVPRSTSGEVLDWVRRQTPDPRHRATVHCILPRGLQAVLARTVLAVVSLASTQPLKVVKTLPEAIDEVLKTEPSFSAAMLAREVDALLALPAPT
jgi:hypothetical protein